MPKKFKFKLEPILKIKTEKIEESKNSLNAAVRNRYEKENEIEKLNDTKKNFLSEKQITLKAADMQASNDYIANINGQVQKKENEKAKLLEIENHRRHQLNEAMKEEKVIIKLKEKKTAEHQKELNREESNFLDEIGTNQYVRNKK